ncbi:hypothetical protein ZIOFF_038015 [Zingiber officinale]|uniref:Uncharacterized protein n=1 Tax=Zingiber officinale TaxID=94328 RepID=A0A8J5GCA8_ZINOF|nr:hypothetical protein ZIOFF_038015 [Zingiber officinale]
MIRPDIETDPPSIDDLIADSSLDLHNQNPQFQSISIAPLLQKRAGMTECVSGIASPPERGAAKGAGALPVLEPPVDAVAVEDVAAVAHPPDLVRGLELGQAHRAAAALASRQVPEPGRWGDLLDQLRRYHREEVTTLPKCSMLDAIVDWHRPGCIDVIIAFKAYKHPEQVVFLRDPFHLEVQILCPYSTDRSR